MTGTTRSARGRAASRDDRPERAAVEGLTRPHQLVGWFCVLGGLVGGLTLLLDGVLRPGGWTVLYAAVVAALLVAGGALLLPPAPSPALLPLVVLSGPLVYVVVSSCVVDPERYSTPLMLLFGVLTGSMVLGPRTFVLNCALVVPALAVTMAPRFPDEPVGLVVQVAGHASILVITAVGVFGLRRRAEHLLERTWQLARTDDLTGLPNRRRLTERATELVAQARRSDRLLAVLVMDLDRFKLVNDEHGHAVGDDVLRAVGAALLGEVRADELAARTGGEEMVVVACVPDAAEASRLALRLQAAVRDCASPVPVTCSTGLAVERPPAGVDPAAWVWHLVDVADGAMFRAKREGRDRVVVDGARTGVALDGAP